MVSVLVVGAGKSSTFLIDILLKNTQKRSSVWNVTIADSDEKALKYKVRNYPNAKIAVLDINNSSQRQKLVKHADIVVSLMPPDLHILLAKDCLQFKKNLITSSYASEEMRTLDAKVKEAGLMFMCEMGLDPGIDHMTGSNIFNSIRKVASEILSFKSYCGGLIAPESDDNPWHYKFSWNPKNIINAGKDGATFLKSGVVTKVAYQDLFAQNDTIECEGVGKLAYYPNRDSMRYIDLYHLHEAKDFMRATLRHTDFCKGWNALIAMGLTDFDRQFDTDNISFNTWIKQATGYNDTSMSVEDFVWKVTGIKDDKTKKMIQWLNLLSEDTIKNGMKSSGDILLNILNNKWKMHPQDKDMVVMQHEIEYMHKGIVNKLVSSMVVKGEDSEFSAMAKTVGMPMAILTDLVVNNQIRIPKGVLIPSMIEVYRPVLNRLEKVGIEFHESISF
ncbi:MAG: saccharopine dehydrogenase C-terminal domain-containing protein [Phycisphaerales bacterium]|nr:saccharopine dehydrogenase C-terminal domain-containing protein [Phycisphaerales bacterium]